MLVSVIIPSYNHARFIEEAVRSVLDQTYPMLELIVVDDGSKDASVEILRSIQDPRLRLYPQKNQGAHAAINRGLSLAQGDYLCVLNSDDIFHPARIERCLRHLDTHPVDLVCSWIEVIDADGQGKGVKKAWTNMRPGWSNKVNQPGFWSLDDFVLNLLSSNFVSTTSNIFMRRTVLEAVGGMRNLRFAHDWDFLLRAAAAFPCGVVEEPLMGYRLHGNNTITSNKAWMLFEACWVLAANLHRFEGNALFPAADKGEKRIEHLRMFSRSVNVAGCDRLMWVLRTYIESGRAAGCPHPEEDPLEDAALRQAFIDLIEEPGA